MNKRWIGGIAALALLVASASAVAGAFSKTYERIPGWDGAPMGALVLVPQGQGSGPFPLIVMPASWSLPNLEYLGRATQLASDGYVVVSYTSRGFWDSAGQIDIAGADTVEDVSAVIDTKLRALEAHASQFESTMKARDEAQLDAFRARIRERLASNGERVGLPAAEIFKKIGDL